MSSTASSDHLLPQRLLWLGLFVFVVVHLYVIFFVANGPYIDESIYIGMGQRVLEGRGLSDGYFSWSNGNPFFWTVMAAVGYGLLKLEGARIVALCFASGALIFFSRAARNLFGIEAALWATWALSLNGLFIALAHLAVYDLPALFALSFSFWCWTKFDQTERRRWLLVSALVFSFGVMAKYAYGLSGLMLLAMTLLRARFSKTWTDAAVWMATVSSVLASYFFFITGDLLWRSLTVYRELPQFFTRSEIAGQQASYNWLPLVLVAAGGVLGWGQWRRPLITTMILSLFVWPIFHLWNGNHVSAEKHLVMGYFFAYPLIGIGLQRLRRSTKRLLTVGALIFLAGWGMRQWYWQEFSWTDVRPAARYLMQHVQRGDKIFVDYSAWVNVYWWYVPDLYPQQIASPFDLFDRYRPEFAQLMSCQTPWLVVRDDDYDSLAVDLQQVVAQCGYERMFASTSQNYFVTGAGTISTYSPTLVVYHLRP